MVNNEIYNPEDVKNEFLTNVLPEYGKTYSRQQLDLAIYMLTDFVNNLAGNDLWILRYEPEPQQQPMQQPMQQQPRQVQQPRGQMPPGYQNYEQNPFEEDVQEYMDPRTQRMRVDEFSVKRDVAEMNQQLRSLVPPRQLDTRMPPIDVRMHQQPQQQQQQQDINLGSEKSKTFVDKIKEMRTPKKKDSINPEE